MAASTSVLVTSGRGGPHARLVCIARDGHALAHHVLFVRGLDLTEAVDDRRRILQREAEEPFAQVERELPRGSRHRPQVALRLEHDRQPGAASTQRVEELLVLTLVATHRPSRKHRGDERLELPERQDRHDAALCRGFRRREAVTVPVFTAGISFANEQDLAARHVARHDHEDRLLLIDSGQIEQVAVLPVLVFHVVRVHANWRAPEDRQRVRRELFHHTCATCFEVVLKRTGPGGGRYEKRDEQGGKERFSQHVGGILPLSASSRRPWGTVRAVYRYSAGFRRKPRADPVQSRRIVGS